MQIVFHMGAHATDQDDILKTLKRNDARLAAQGVLVPWPGRYRLVLRDALLALQGQAADEATQDAILASVIEGDDPRRLVFSHAFFLCIPQRVITPQGLYASAGGRIGPMLRLFPEAEVEFHLAMVNPALLIPWLLERIPNTSYESLMGGLSPLALRWAPVVSAIVRAAEGRRVVVWCHEDLPLVWPEVLRRVAGVGPEAALEGDFTLLGTIMAPEGLARLRGYLAAHPPQSVPQRRKIISAFLDKFALPEALDVDLPLPGWTEDLVGAITAQYEAEAAAIAGMEGVEFIAP